MLVEDIAGDGNGVSAVAGGVREAYLNVVLDEFFLCDVTVDPFAWAGAKAETKTEDIHLQRVDGSYFWCEILEEIVRCKFQGGDVWCCGSVHPGKEGCFTCRGQYVVYCVCSRKVPCLFVVLDIRVCFRFPAYSDSERAVVDMSVLGVSIRGLCRWSWCLLVDVGDIGWWSFGWSFWKWSCDCFWWSTFSLYCRPRACDGRWFFVAVRVFRIDVHEVRFVVHSSSFSWIGGVDR